MISWLALGIVIWLASKGASGGDEKFGCLSLLAFAFLVGLGFLVGSVIGDKYGGVRLALFIASLVWFIGLLVQVARGLEWRA